MDPDPLQQAKRRYETGRSIWPEWDLDPEPGVEVSSDPRGFETRFVPLGTAWNGDAPKILASKANKAFNSTTTSIDVVNGMLEITGDSRHQVEFTVAFLKGHMSRLEGKSEAQLQNEIDIGRWNVPKKKGASTFLADTFFPTEVITELEELTACLITNKETSASMDIISGSSQALQKTLTKLHNLARHSVLPPSQLDVHFLYSTKSNEFACEFIHLAVHDRRALRTTFFDRSKYNMKRVYGRFFERGHVLRPVYRESGCKEPMRPGLKHIEPAPSRANLPQEFPAFLSANGWGYKEKEPTRSTIPQEVLEDADVNSSATDSVSQMHVFNVEDEEDTTIIDEAASDVYEHKNDVQEALDPFRSLWESIRSSKRPDAPRVAERDEFSLRTYHETMYQKAPQHGTRSKSIPKPSSVGLKTAQNFQDQMLRVMTSLQAQYGFITLKARFGRFVFTPKSASSRCMKPPETLQFMQQEGCDDKNNRTFAEILTTHGREIHDIAQVRNGQGIPTWTTIKGARHSKYEFTCRKEVMQGKSIEFIVLVNGLDFTFQIRQAKPKTSNTWVHCLDQSFDICVEVAVSRDLDAECGSFAKELVDSLTVT